MIHFVKAFLLMVQLLLESDRKLRRYRGSGGQEQEIIREGTLFYFGI